MSRAGGPRRNRGRRSLTGALAVLLVLGAFPGGALIAAAADVTAQRVGQPVYTSTWSPPANEPSGIAYIDHLGYYLVVDTNADSSGNANGWRYLPGSPATSVRTGIREPTGVDYDPTTRTLFITNDHDSTITVIKDFGTASETRRIVNVGDISCDTEDPAYDRNTGILYFIDGCADGIFSIDPGGDGIFGTADDKRGFFSLRPLASRANPDFEGLAWDPETGHLLAGNRDDREIYELTTSGALVRKIFLPTQSPRPTWISGMGIAPASFGGGALTIWVTDRDTSAIYEYSVDPVPQSPPVAEDLEYTAVVGNPRTIELKATDANQDPLTYHIVSGPTKGNLSGGNGPNRTYTATETGVDTFTYKANDGGRDSNIATVTIVVTAPPVNQAPVIDDAHLPNGIGIPEGEQYRLDLRGYVDDVEGDALTFTKRTGPGSLSSQGIYTWTPAEDQNGSHTITFRVTDNGSSKSADGQFRLVVEEVNSPPSVSVPGGTRTNTEGDTVDVPVSVADPDIPANALTVTASGLPPGLTYDSTTRRIRGQISGSASVGSPYPVTVRVVDDGEPSLGDEYTFTWIVEPKSPAEPPPGEPNPGPGDPTGPEQPPASPGKPDTTGQPGTPPVEPIGPDNPFGDDAGVFEDDIEWLAARGITRGCNPPRNDLFCPNHFVTRGQMAAFLARAFSYRDQGGNHFIDDDGAIFERDIERLFGAGVTRGCNPPHNTRFCPGEYVTRAQMAAFLARALELSGSSRGNRYVDDDGNLFEREIEILADAGVARGCNPPRNDRFCPNDYITRGQMAALLHRVLGD